MEIGAMAVDAAQRAVQELDMCRARLAAAREALEAYEWGHRMGGWTPQAEGIRLCLQDEVAYWNDRVFWARVYVALAERGGGDGRDDAVLG